MEKRYDFLARRTFLSMEDRGHDTDAAWQRVKARCGEGRKAVLRRHIWRYAVAVMIVLALGGYFLGRQWLDNHGQPLAAGDIFEVKGTSGVKLVLANGQHVSLDALEGNGQQEKEVALEDLGIKLRRGIGEEALQYEVTTDNSSEETGYNFLIVPRGGGYSLRMEDGSEVWLNSESSLRFPVRFAKGVREVYLEGEAYFQVAKNVNAPFRVHTGGRTVTVLGTSFNVSSYQVDEVWAVTRVEGKVTVDAGKGERILYPSEQYSIDVRTGEHVVKKVDTDLYTSWRDGKFNFKSMRFEDIVHRLQRWYDFEIVYADEEIRDILFRGVAYKNRPLEETLRNLEVTFDIVFDIQGKVITVKKKE